MVLSLGCRFFFYPVRKKEKAFYNTTPLTEREPIFFNGKIRLNHKGGGRKKEKKKLSVAKHATKLFLPSRFSPVRKRKRVDMLNGGSSSSPWENGNDLSLEKKKKKLKVLERQKSGNNRGLMPSIRETQRSGQVFRFSWPICSIPKCT